MPTDIISVIEKDKSLDKYSDPTRLSEDAVPYIGQPKQNESDPDKIFLRLNPLSSNGAILEFKTNDIVFAENVKLLLKSSISQ